MIRACNLCINSSKKTCTVKQNTRFTANILPHSLSLIHKTPWTAGIRELKFYREDTAEQTHQNHFTMYKLSNLFITSVHWHNDRYRTFNVFHCKCYEVCFENVVTYVMLGPYCILIATHCCHLLPISKHLPTYMTEWDSIHLSLSPHMHTRVEIGMILPQCSHLSTSVQQISLPTHT
jgi:hypothetical protein